jgi:hypothetical protein
MTTFALIPGAGSDSWYWSRVAPLLTDLVERLARERLGLDRVDTVASGHLAALVAPRAVVAWLL